MTTRTQVYNDGFSEQKYCELLINQLKVILSESENNNV